MKLKNNSNEKFTDLTPMLSKDSTLKSSTCNHIQVFLLLLILWLSAVLFLCTCLRNYVDDTENIQVSKSDSQHKIDTNINFTTNKFCLMTSDDYKFDCFPRGKANRKNCEERNCCWSPSSQNSLTPWCYYPSNYSNYEVINVTKSRNEIISFFKLSINSSYKNDIKMLCMDISLQTAQRLRIKVN